MALHTKQDFQAWMHKFLNPLKPLYSSGCARLKLGDTGATYPRVSIEMEAFSRPLWALVPFWAGSGRDEEFELIYKKGLINGTNPAHPEYWGGFTNYDQRFVEMTAIACGILFAPDRLWSPLSGKEKEQLAHWLYGINEHILPDCNWQFFMILVNVALKRCGMPYDSKNMLRGLEKIESYYLGGGWYRDGDSGQKDYYISFAMHYYGLIYAVAMEQEDPRSAVRFKERAQRFARDFIYWFAPDGSALPYGRSLSYRFGQAAFWSAYLFAGLDDIPVEVIKGILCRHLKWWERQTITDRDGVLTIGYAYPNLIMAERYNAPGSPYWGMKTLLCLALPDNHPFWNAQESPLPKLEKLRALSHADMLIQRRENDVICYPAGVCERYGHGHVPEKYAKFAYSTHFGFSCARSQLVLHENCPDSMLAFVIDGSDYVFVREASEQWNVQNDCVQSIWSPFPGIRVKTTIMPTPTGHTRLHEIESKYSCSAYDCGFSVDKFIAGYGEKVEKHCVSVVNNAGGCTVSGNGEGCLIGADPNTNVLYKNSEIPAIKYRIKSGNMIFTTEVLTVTFN